MSVLKKYKFILTGSDLIFILLITGFVICFFISKQWEEKKLVHKQITYTAGEIAEAYIVWGVNDLLTPAEKYQPPGSYLKDGMVYNKMQQNKDTFSIDISLPNGYTLNYWIRLTKNNKGESIDLWRSGDQNTFNVHFTAYNIFRPGYFLLIAGFIPLLIAITRLRRKTQNIGPIPVDQEKYSFKGYIKEFDAIRALAVLLVIIHHWLPEKHFLNAYTPNGVIGVTLFFVLSGFLITRILLEQKKKAESGNIKKIIALKNFIARRSLRIFPIYFFLLMVLYIIRNEEMLTNAAWYLTYTSNILYYKNQYFPGGLAHTWSLGVEEQFYLFWPLLMLHINKKLLPQLIIFFIIMGFSCNYIFAQYNWWGTLLTPACFDALGLGALLAFLVVYRTEWIDTFRLVLKPTLFFAATLAVLNIFNFISLPERTIWSFLALGLISYCIFDKKNKFLNFILCNRWLVFTGKISYGVYLYHLFIPQVWKAVLDQFDRWHIDPFLNHYVPSPIHNAWIFLQQLSLLILLSFLSWKIIELPINNLKRRFV